MSQELQAQNSANQLSPLSAIKQALGNRVKAEPYTAQITRKNPTAIVFLLDQSDSMSEQMKGKDDLSKADFASRILNQTLQELINVATGGEGLRNYIDVAVIGYGGEDQNNSYFLIREGGFLMLTELANHVIRTESISVEKTIRGITKLETKEIPVWIEPVAESLTPMGNAFDKAYALLESWISSHPYSYPPTIINISDGAPTDAKDAEMLEKANRLKALNTQDGNVILLNAHLDTNDRAAAFFPASRDELPDSKYARLMYNMSSILPEQLNRQVAVFRNQDLQEDTQFVGMTYQASAEQFIKLLDIGTRSQTQKINANA